jgi:pimeloyl-ACP methyl ester carboxylesterase
VREPDVGHFAMLDAPDVVVNAEIEAFPRWL